MFQAEQINLFQSKWSGLKKMVILSENSCHCNAMQCNFNEGDKLGADRPLSITVGVLGKNCLFYKYVPARKKNILAATMISFF